MTSVLLELTRQWRLQQQKITLPVCNQIVSWYWVWQRWIVGYVTRRLSVSDFESGINGALIGCEMN